MSGPVLTALTAMAGALALAAGLLAAGRLLRPGNSRAAAARAADPEAAASDSAASGSIASDGAVSAAGGAGASGMARHAWHLVALGLLFHLVLVPLVAWGTVFGDLVRQRSPGLIGLAVFLLILALALAHAWRAGLLDVDPPAATGLPEPDGDDAP